MLRIGHERLERRNVCRRGLEIAGRRNLSKQRKKVFRFFLVTGALFCSDYTGAATVRTENSAKWDRADPSNSSGCAEESNGSVLGGVRVVWMLVWMNEDGFQCFTHRSFH